MVAAAAIAAATASAAAVAAAAAAAAAAVAQHRIGYVLEKQTITERTALEPCSLKAPNVCNVPSISSTFADKTERSAGA